MYTLYITENYTIHWWVCSVYTVHHRELHYTVMGMNCIHCTSQRTTLCSYGYELYRLYITENHTIHWWVYSVYTVHHRKLHYTVIGMNCINCTLQRTTLYIAGYVLYTLHKRIGVCKSIYGNVRLNNCTFLKPPCMLRTRLTIEADLNKLILPVNYMELQ